MLLILLVLLILINKSITISQTVIYKNTSDDTLKEVYLSNWNNSYSTKSTALAKRFEEELVLSFI